MVARYLFLLLRLITEVPIYERSASNLWAGAYC